MIPSSGRSPYYNISEGCHLPDLKDLPLYRDCRKEQRGPNAGVSAQRGQQSSSRDSPIRVPRSIFHPRCTRPFARVPLQPSAASPHSCKCSVTENVVTNCALGRYSHDHSIHPQQAHSPRNMPSKETMKSFRTNSCVNRHFINFL
jgi:hypothetical protein